MLLFDLSSHVNRRDMWITHHNHTFVTWTPHLFLSATHKNCGRDGAATGEFYHHKGVEVDLPNGTFDGDHEKFNRYADLSFHAYR